MKLEDLIKRKMEARSGNKKVSKIKTIKNATRLQDLIIRIGANHSKY